MHVWPGAHWAADVHPTAQRSPAQLVGLHDRLVPARQAPAPSHVPAATSTPAAQLGAAHSVPMARS
jgi:hypothetical protein